MEISGGDGGIQRFFEASPGDRFTLISYLRKEGSSAWTGFGIDFQNQQGETIAEYALAPDITGEYKPFSMTREAPNSTVQVEIWFYRSESNCTLYVDDVCFYLHDKL